MILISIIAIGFRSGVWTIAALQLIDGLSLPVRKNYPIIVMVSLI